MDINHTPSESRFIPIHESDSESEIFPALSPQSQVTSPTTTFDGHSLAQSETSSRKRSLSSISSWSDFTKEKSPSQQTEIAHVADVSSLPKEPDAFPRHFKTHKLTQQDPKDLSFSNLVYDSDEEVEHQGHNNENVQKPYSPGDDFGFFSELDSEQESDSHQKDLSVHSSPSSNLPPAQPEYPSPPKLTSANNNTPPHPTDPVDAAQKSILHALQENSSLSHEEALQIARTTLTSEGAKERTLEDKAFKSVAHVFNKLLHKNSSIASPDAHLKNQDRFYDADVEHGLKNGFSKQKAHQYAMIHAGQRSLYFNPKLSPREAQNQARTGIQAARDYFVYRKNIFSESLPTVEELLPEVMKRGIMSR